MSYTHITEKYIFKKLQRFTNEFLYNSSVNDKLKEMILEASGHAGSKHNFNSLEELDPNNKPSGKIRFEIEKTTFLLIIILSLLFAAAGIFFSAHALAQVEINNYKSGGKNVEVVAKGEVETNDGETAGARSDAESNKSNNDSSLEGETTQICEKSESAVSAEGVVNINKADVAQLQTLSGIGPSIAQKIVDYRNENGSFRTTADIKSVKGIGEAMYGKIKDKITVK